MNRKFFHDNSDIMIIIKNWITKLKCITTKVYS